MGDRANNPNAIGSIVPLFGGGGGGVGGNLVAVSSADTTPDFLDDKLDVGEGLSEAILNPGGNEILEITNTAPGGLLFGAASVGSSTTTRFLFPGNANGAALTATFGISAPRNGLLRSMIVLQNVPAGNGNSIVYTLTINGTPQLLTVSMASTAAFGFDLVNTAAVVAGDVLSLVVTKAAGIVTSPTQIVVSMEFIS